MTSYCKFHAGSPEWLTMVGEQGDLARMRGVRGALIRVTGKDDRIW